VRAALAGLGYAPEEIREALAELPDDGAIEDLLRDALKALAVSS
jgi:Holliday junction resolvasome RuvABC DNA-binding subunit